MKRLYRILIFLFSLPALSQTTVFSEGWGTEPVEIISAEKTAIVFCTHSQGRGTFGNILKYKVAGNEYQKVASQIMPEILVDYRFDANNKLMLIGLKVDLCDYQDYTNFWVYQIDTSNFIIDTNYRVSSIGSFNKVVFVNDTLLALSDKNGTKVYSLTTSQFVYQSSFTRGHNSIYYSSLFDGQFLFSQEWLSGICTIERIDGVGNYTKIGSVSQEPTNSYSYSSDSIILVTDSNVFKTDTTLFPNVSISIPFHKSNKIVGNKLYLINDQTCHTYSLPKVNLISIDTLKGLPSKFTLEVVEPTSQGLSALAFAYNRYSMNEMVVKRSIDSQNETARSELRLSSIKAMDTVILDPGTINFRYEVRYVLTLHNDSLDTINYLSLKYVNHPIYSNCDEYKSRDVNLTLAPGASDTISQKVIIQQSANICMWVGIPNQHLENDLSNNRSCSYFTMPVSLEEQTGIDYLKVFPNPSNGRVFVEGNVVDINKVGVIGVDGRHYDISTQIVSETMLSFDFATLSPGIYLLKIESNGKVFNRKLIKQ